MGEHAVVISTAGSEDEARRIASALVERRLAACVNVVPGIHSVYRWKNAIEQAEEWMLVVKTRRDRFDDVRAAIRELNSYELPEAVMLELSAGDPRYLAWIDSCL